MDWPTLYLSTLPPLHQRHHQKYIRRGFWETYNLTGMYMRMYSLFTNSWLFIITLIPCCFPAGKTCCSPPTFSVPCFHSSPYANPSLHVVHQPISLSSSFCVFPSAFPSSTIFITVFCLFSVTKIFQLSDSLSFLLFLLSVSTGFVFTYLFSFPFRLNFPYSSVYPHA